MRTILTSISNSLMAMAITQSIEGTGRFRVYSVPPDDPMITEKCVVPEVDIILMEASYDACATLEGRLKAVRALRSAYPSCKVIFFCDENSSPEIARNIVMAKKDGAIDDFFYSSVSDSYLTAMLDAI